MMKYLLVLFLIVGCKGQRPTQLGIHQLKLLPCPDKPNCVSSHMEGTDNYIGPIKIESSKDEAYSKLKKILSNHPNAKIQKAEPKYIYAEFTTPVLGFVDDVEFYFGEEGKVHMRSASRVGHYDFNANRKRLEEIKFKFYQNDIN